MTLNIVSHPMTFARPRYLSGRSAWVEHIPFAFALASMLKPRILVELGTHYGDSYCAFCQTGKDLVLDMQCFAVDTWQGDEHAGFYGDDVLNTLRQAHDVQYGAFSTLLRCTFDEAAENFSKGSIDLLHIDGLHTYEAVKHDFETWLPLLSNRAVVLFHDTAVREREFGVWKLWEELSTQYPSFSFHHGHGLGVLGVGSDLPADIREFLSLNEAEAVQMRNAFAQLGSRIEREAAFGAALSNQMSRVAELDSQLADMRRDVMRLQDELAAASAKAVESEARAGESEAHTAGSEAHAAESDARAAESDVRAAEFEARAAALEHQLVVLQQSRSWKAVSVIRKIRHAFALR